MKPRLMIFVLACLLLLSGCGQDAQSGDPSPSGEPSPTPAADTASPAVDTPSPAEDTASPEVSVSAALTPTPSPSPTPEPTEEVKELWGFPIDNTHDAFEVPTGGRLGTVLVTVEMKTEDEHTSIFSVWDASDLTEPIQTMEQEGVATHTYKLLDANFDDCMDFCYTQYKGAKNENYCLYIWDEEQGKFSFVESFLGSPGTNSKNKTFDNWSSGSIASGIHEIYRWEDNKLVCVRRVEMDYTAEHGDELVVRDLVNGEMVEVFRKYCPLGSSMDLDLWLDPDYHGEGADLLLQQTFDDTHDAFLVPTGGKLGTLLVTVEAAEEENKVYFSVWTIDAMDAPIQTMTVDAPHRLQSSRLIDANFDGYTDFCYTYALYASNASFGLWIWNEEQERFIPTEQLVGMGLSADEETQTLSQWVHGSAVSGQQEYYCWEDGELVCFRVEEYTYPHGESDQELVIYERVNGELVEISREPHQMLG